VTDTAYWAAQVRELVTDDVDVSERPDQGDVAVKLPDEDNTREERASLIAALERAGVTVTTVTSSPVIHVDASAEPLDYPYDSSVEFER